MHFRSYYRTRLPKLRANVRELLRDEIVHMSNSTCILTSQREPAGEITDMSVAFEEGVNDFEKNIC